MNSSNSSTTGTTHSSTGRQPLNPLLLTSSSENIRSKSNRDSEETFCSKYEENSNRKASTDLFSNAGSNLNDLINILSKTDLNGKKEPKKEKLDRSELVSTEYQRPSNSFSSPGFAKNVKSDDEDEVVFLSSGDATEEEDTDSVIEVSSSSTDENEKVEARINFMTSSVESRASSSRSTLGRNSRMERFLKDVSQNLKSLRLEDDFKVKNMNQDSEINFNKGE